MKLLVLSLCLVTVLATESVELKRNQELESALDEFSNELEDAEIAETDNEGLRKHIVAIVYSSTIAVYWFHSQKCYNSLKIPLHL